MADGKNYGWQLRKRNVMANYGRQIMVVTFMALNEKCGNVRKAEIPLKCGRRRFLVQIWKVWSVVRRSFQSTLRLSALS